jgi:GT2 family glycosyltransferase
VESAFAQEHPDVEVVVIDDGTVRGDVAEALDGLPDRQGQSLRLHRLHEPKGAGPARNAAAEVATGHVLCFLDDDAFFEDAQTLAGIAEQFRSPNPPGIVALRIIDEDPSGRERTMTPDSWLRRRRFPELAMQEHDVAVFKGGGFAIERTLYRSVGGVEPWMVDMGEESDMAYKVIQAGRRIRYIPRLWVRHRRGPRTRDARGDRSRVHLQVRNRVYLLYRYVPTPKVWEQSLYWIAMLGYYAMHSVGDVPRALLDAWRSQHRWPRTPLTGAARRYVRRTAGWLWP